MEPPRKLRCCLRSARTADCSTNPRRSTHLGRPVAVASVAHRQALLALGSIREHRDTNPSIPRRQPKLPCDSHGLGLRPSNIPDLTWPHAAGQRDGHGGPAARGRSAARCHSGPGGRATRERAPQRRTPRAGLGRRGGAATWAPRGQASSSRGQAQATTRSRGHCDLHTGHSFSLKPASGPGLWPRRPLPEWQAGQLEAGSARPGAGEGAPALASNPWPVV